MTHEYESMIHTLEYDAHVHTYISQVREKASGKEQPNVPLNLALVYEAGTEVHSQEILQVQSDTQLLTNDNGRANLKVCFLRHFFVDIFRGASAGPLCQ